MDVSGEHLEIVSTKYIQKAKVACEEAKNLNENHDQVGGALLSFTVLSSPLGSTVRSSGFRQHVPDGTQLKI